MHIPMVVLQSRYREWGYSPARYCTCFTNETILPSPTTKSYPRRTKTNHYTTTDAAKSFQHSTANHKCPQRAPRLGRILQSHPYNLTLNTNHIAKGVRTAQDNGITLGPHWGSTFHILSLLLILTLTLTLTLTPLHSRWL